MRWCLLLQGTLLMVFSIAAAQDDTLEIKAFLKKDTSSYAVQFSTTHPGMPDASIIKYLVIKTVEGTPTEQTESYTSSPPVSIGSEWEVTFTDPIELAILSGKTVHLVLNGLDAAHVPVIKGEISITDFPEVAQGFSGQLATIINQQSPKPQALTGNTLRVTATNLGDSTSITPVPVGTEAELDTVRYYLGAGTDKSYSLCVTKTIEVCDEPVPMTETSMINSLTVDMAKLSYEDPVTTKAKIVLSVTSAGSPPSTRMEVILTTDGSSSLILPGEVIGTPDVELQLESYTIGKDMDLDIIGLNPDIMVEYVYHHITDYEVYGTSIGDTSLEVRWKFQNPEHTYFISRDGGGTGFTQASVTCNPDTLLNKVCFGYFPGLAPNEFYRVTVDIGDGNKKTNSIESAPIAVGNPLLQGLQLQHRLDWHRNGMEALLRVCFNHSSQNYKRDFSHYELVIISNDNGKWFKHRLMTQDTEGDLCFSPQTISKHNFFSSKGATIIVIQRATDGLTVLSSGETQL